MLTNSNCKMALSVANNIKIMFTRIEEAIVSYEKRR